MIRATKSQIKEFEESFIWKDIVDYLHSRQISLPDQVGQLVLNARKGILDQGQVMISLGDISGEQATIDDLLRLPEILLAIKQADEEAAKHKPAEGSEEDE